MKVSVTGLSRLNKAFSDYDRNKQGELRDLANGSALIIETGAKERSPFDTGRLRSSVHAIPANTTDNSFSYTDIKGQSHDGATQVQTGELDAAVATNVEYAPKQERIHGFLNAAYEAEARHYQNRVAKAMKRL